jgi:hypothetical protein
MKKSRTRIVWLFLGLFVGISVSGMAQWRRPGPWTDPGLNLTDEQLAKIQEARLAFQERIMPLTMQWQRLQMNLDSLTWKKADQKQTNSAYEALDKVDAELEKAYQEHWNEVRNLLDERQRIIFDRFGGLGMGAGWGMNPRWRMRTRLGRGFGAAWGPGMGRGFRGGWGLNLGPGFGGGWGRGMGRGYFCPWFRWR